jgi:hypothetical protein
MDNILSEFKVQDSEIKLTNERLYIRTPASYDIYALRSICGIQTYDLIDDYDKKIVEWQLKQAELNTSSRGVLGVLLILFIIFLLFVSVTADSPELFAITLFIGLIAGVYLIFSPRTIPKTLPKPDLFAVVRILTIAGNKDIKFNKSSSESIEMSKFVISIASTLGAHK